MHSTKFLVWVLPIAIACGSAGTANLVCPDPTPPLPQTNEASATKLLSIVGTNDVHGRIASTPTFGGFLANLRRARELDHGGVVLVDGGDMWQGTIESNSNEGAAAVRAYNALGYDAAAIGNHEFDYGPVGAASTPSKQGDDPRGALLARASETNFPLLAANLVSNSAPVKWPNVKPFVVIERAGVRVGIIGVTTEETMHTTISGNVEDLATADVAKSIADYAAELRSQHQVSLVVVAAHVGGKCHRFSDPEDHESCKKSEEVIKVANAIPKGLVDVIVAGHTHAGVAHRVNGIAIIESYANGYAFGRVDFLLESDSNKVIDVRIFEPQAMCLDRKAKECVSPRYEGRAVVPDAAVEATIKTALADAETIRQQSLNVTLIDRFSRNYHSESPLGNWLADQMHALRPKADFALLNSGGVRASIDKGELRFGALYETFPFDNRFAMVELNGAQLKAIILRNLRSDSGTYIYSGLTVRATCTGGTLEVELKDRRGKKISDDKTLNMVTSDYLATGTGFGPIRQANEAAVKVEEGMPIRDLIAAHLKSKGGEFRANDSHNKKKPRVVTPSHRPVRCQ